MHEHQVEAIICDIEEAVTTLRQRKKEKERRESMLGEKGGQ